MDAIKRGSGEQVREMIASEREAAASLARIVVDRAEPTDLRAAAAVALGRGLPKGEEALATAVADPEPGVVRRAAEALGRVGGPEAAAVLAAVKLPDEPAAARAVRFARRLHAARHNQAAGIDEPRPALARFDEGTAASLEPAKPSEGQLAELAEVLQHELPGIPVNPAGAVALTCGKNRFLVVPHAKVTGLAGSGVPAVVMKRAQSLGSYSVFLYILAAPAGEGRLALTAWRTDGSLAGEGEATLKGGARFTLKALDTLYLPPVEIAGVVEPSGALMFETARVAAPIKDGQRTRVPIAG